MQGTPGAGSVVLPQPLHLDTQGRVSPVPVRGEHRGGSIHRQGCGTCVAACPAGAIRGSAFSDEQVLAQTMTELVEEVRALGPLRWPARPRPAPVAEEPETAEAAEATP